MRESGSLTDFARFPPLRSIRSGSKALSQSDTSDTPNAKAHSNNVQKGNGNECDAALREVEKSLKTTEDSQFRANP